MMDLKPCPHCDGPSRGGRLGGSAWFMGTDHSEDCLLSDFQRTEADLVRRWNTRPREDALQAEVERLREALIDAYNCFRVYGEHMPEYMHGEPLKVHLKRYDAALKGAPHE